MLASVVKQLACVLCVSSCTSRSALDLRKASTHKPLHVQCALLANSAGVGGGPFYVPLLNVVVGFNLKDCTGLSHTIVATSAVASTLYGQWCTLMYMLHTRYLTAWSQCTASCTCITSALYLYLAILSNAHFRA